jgi:hypothetical protein
MLRIRFLAQTALASFSPKFTMFRMVNGQLYRWSIIALGLATPVLMAITLFMK